MRVKETKYFETQDQARYRMAAGKMYAPRPRVPIPGANDRMLPMGKVGYVDLEWESKPTEAEKAAVAPKRTLDERAYGGAPGEDYCICGHDQDTHLDGKCQDCKCSHWKKAGHAAESFDDKIDATFTKLERRK